MYLCIKMYEITELGIGFCLSVKAERGCEALTKLKVYYSS